MAEMLVVVSYFGAMTFAVWLIGVITGGGDEAANLPEPAVVKAHSTQTRRSVGRRGRR